MAAWWPTSRVARSRLPWWPAHRAPDRACPGSSLTSDDSDGWALGPLRRSRVVVACSATSSRLSCHNIQLQHVVGRPPSSRGAGRINRPVARNLGARLRARNRGPPRDQLRKRRDEWALRSGRCATRTHDLSRVNRFEPLSVTWGYPGKPSSYGNDLNAVARCFALFTVRSRTRARH